MDKQLMNDFKYEINLLTLIEKYTPLRRKAATNGGEWCGPCPRCGGTDHFLVWPTPTQGAPRFHCIRGCGWHGDAITFVRGVENLDFKGALEFLGHTKSARSSGNGNFRTQVQLKTATPPDPLWQTRGRQFIEYTVKQLWLSSNGNVLEYLYGRGLTEEIVWRAQIGYNPTLIYDKPASWGKGNPDAKPVYLPRGWVFPWEVGGHLWRIGIRRPNEDLRAGASKMIGPAGYSADMLYLADHLSPNKPAILVEGEITALTIKQAAGDIVAVVATGGTSHARTQESIKLLERCPIVLVSFDNDGQRGENGTAGTKGEGASQWWLQKLLNARRWRPLWGDANDMAQDGADVRRWVELGLTTC